MAAAEVMSLGFLFVDFLISVNISQDFDIMVMSTETTENKTMAYAHYLFHLTALCLGMGVMLLGGLFGTLYICDKVFGAK